MSHRPEIYIEDIREAIQRTEKYEERLSDEELGEDDTQTDAVESLDS